MRFDDRVTGNLATYAKQAKVIHFELDAAEVNKNVKSDIAVLADVKDSLVEIMQYVNKAEHKEWMKEFDKLYQVEVDAVINDQLNPTKEGLTMGEVVNGISKESKGEAIMVSDVGQHQMFAWRYSNFSKTRSNVTSGGLGTMGFALPAAIGAKMGAPDREVVAIIGDGGYQMTCNELGTILQTKAAVKIVVLNNSYLGMVRQWQELFFDKRYASTEMVSPNFVKLAEAYDIEAVRVSKREDLAGAIKTMMASKDAYFLEVVIEQEDNVFPMIPTGASVSDIRLS
jgi:acetolactate synthase-1/2/3 large subunit